MKEMDNTKRNDEPRISKLTWTKTFSLIAAWVAMGMTHSLLPATLPDLRSRVGVTVEEMGRALAFRGLGGVVGALLGSISDRYHDKSNLFMSLFIMITGLVLILRPWSPSLWILTINLFTEGISLTLVNTVGNVMLLNIWGEQSGAPMQALHFGYPVGAMIGPLIAYPFVSMEAENITSNITATDVPYTTTDMSHMDTSQIQIPYAIVGCYDLLIGVLFLIHHVANLSSSNKQNQNKTSKTSWKEVFSPSKWADGDGNFGLTIMLFLMLFYFINTATILGSAIYYPSYAIESDLQFTNQQGTLYTSALNLAGGLGRASGIIANLFIPIKYFFPIIVFGQLSGATINLIWGLENKVSYVITSCVYTYMSFPVWPSGYAWADRYVHLFAIGIGLTDIASRVSDIIFSYLLAYLYEYTVKESIFYNTVAAGSVLSIIAVIMSVIASKHGSKYQNNKHATSTQILCAEKDESTKF